MIKYHFRFFRFFIILSLLVSSLSVYPAPQTTLDLKPAKIASAYFGLDNAMPENSRLLCWRGVGLDGLPVTFSHRVTGDILPSAFTVTTRSGKRLHPICATTKPAKGKYKNNTVLLIGELGSDKIDPPVKVEVTGNLLLTDNENAKGLSANIIQIGSGPTLALSMSYTFGEIKSNCPQDTKTIVVAVWSGGVVPAPGKTQTDHLFGYSVQTKTGFKKPFAIGDISDYDNYVHLCYDKVVNALFVNFEAGNLKDPNGSLNPETSIEVSPEISQFESSSLRPKN
jgi:hypothetical protein